MKTIKIIWITIAGIILLLTLVTCSDDDECPTCPSITDVELPDLDVYFWMNNSVDIGVYNMATNIIHDTIAIHDLITGELTDMAVSGDEGELILTELMGSTNDKVAYIYKTSIYDLPTLEKISEYDIGYTIELSSGGKYYAIYGSNETGFFDGNTHQLLFSDELLIEYGRFTLDESKFYGCAGNTNEIVVYDMTTLEKDTAFQYIDNDGSTRSLYKVVPVDNGKKLYIETPYYYNTTEIALYSTELDSTLLSYYVVLLADLRLTPDGKYVIATDAGNCFIDVPGSYDIIYFDAENDKLAAIVPGWWNIYTYNADAGIAPGFLEFSLDGRYTFVGGDCWSHRFAIIDNFQHVIIESEYHEDMYFEAPSCRKVP